MNDWRLNWSSRQTLVVTMVLCLVGQPQPVVAVPPVYQLHFLGLFDDLHTADLDGRTNSSFGRFIDTNGNNLAIIGQSTRYRGNEPDGDSGWHFDIARGRVSQIGLFLDTDSTRATAPRAVNANGFAIGSTALGSSVPRPDHAWIYDPLRGESIEIGLSGRPDLGTIEAENAAVYIAAEGTVVGVWNSGTGGSNRYVWVYDPKLETTSRIGLLDNQHLEPATQGHQSDFLAMSPAGHIVGTSARISAMGGGRSVWQYVVETGQSMRLGFYGGIYTPPNGEEDTRFSIMNDSGYVGGSSFAVWPSPGGVRSASAGWVYDPNASTTHKVGLSQPGNTDSNEGFRSDGVAYISPTGFAIGSSSQGANDVVGTWISDLKTGVTTRLGYYDAAHTRSAGRQRSVIHFYDENGRIVGASQRSVGGLAQSAWVYDHNTGITTQLGLLTPDYFAGGTGGAHETRVTGMNSDGLIIGATRNGGNQTAGVEFAAWIYDPQSGTTKRIGELAARSANIRNNWPKALNNAGHVVGGDDTALWFYDPSLANDGHLIGLLDVRHFAPEFGALTESGFVSGYSIRTNGVSELSKTAWIFDPSTLVTTPLEFSQATSGRAFSEIDFISDDGTVIGRYDLYDGNILLGRRVFHWSQSAGFRDISNLISVSDSQFEWSGYIDSVRSANEHLISGMALLTGGRKVPFALRLVPEPTSLILCMFAIAALSLRSARPGMRTA